MLVYTPQRKRGKGLLNKLINNLPVELHLPGYQYCGPGTKLRQRLARGDPGINDLDSACKQHDIAYSQHPENIVARNQADKILADQAWKRVKDPNASIGEKAAAILINQTMATKMKLGMGVRKTKKRRVKRRVKRPVKQRVKRRVKRPRKRKSRSKKKKVTIRRIIISAKNAMKLNKGSCDAIKSALQGAREAIKLIGGRCNVSIPKVFRVPKVGGILPLLVPIFAGLSAAGAVAGGAAGIARAVNQAKDAARQLSENKRHNETMEAIALGKGLYLKPYKTGMGLYLKPKNFK